MIQVLMVEDHPLVKEGIMAILADEADINCAGHFYNGTDLLYRLKSFQPDVILMDLDLPDMTGLDLCRKVKNLYPAVCVVALSINNQAGIIKKMMENGASGYVLKDAAQHEITEAIRTVVKGKQYFSRSASLYLRKADTSQLPPLTRREKQVLEKIADGLTNPQIAELLFVDVSTVNSHRKNMLAKFGVQNTAALIKLAIKENLI
ncbi:response regulator transcription factor [Mucilaginibacter sp. ZT4R22]|uniref:Response regulator transcription factor n=1 Tax=Mucilaginibacter pankratovii TaxID=2772110 RepID=A0ABR7WQJ6_9SPHI|nr:response regulator transcription factor [Mucilaginibacter pankratovii]MBD1364572.1 response regulator transcription factor [Mucilaginibacter pankratovii]